LNCACAVMEGQAQFNPSAFARGLARSLAARGCLIHEATAATELEAADGQVKCGPFTMRASHVICATHTPKGFNLVQTELGPYREHAIAFEANRAWPETIFWTLEEHRHSIRRHVHEGREYTVVLGARHKTGQAEDTEACFRALEEFARSQLGAANIAYRWSAQGYYPADGLPYIGRAAGSGRLLIATGFAADGLTYAAVAAPILCGEVMGTPEPDADLFHPTRIKAQAAKKFVAENANTVVEYVRDYAALLRAPEVEALPAGEGRIVQVDGKRCAVHRTAAGDIQAVSPFCTHLRCVVHWNNAESTWDCPCHGSRFNPDGSVIEGPALAPLAPLRRE
jgi:Rieske Fe-S protein